MNNLESFEGIPSGTINGDNRVFELRNGDAPLTVLPSFLFVWRNSPLIPGLGYTGPRLVSGRVQITMTVAPDEGDSLYAQGLVPIAQQ